MSRTQQLVGEAQSRATENSGDARGQADIAPSCAAISVNPRQATMPIALAQPSRSPAVDDFILNLHNRISAAQDHIKQSQAKAADQRKGKTRVVVFQAGDLILLNTEH